MCYAEKTHGALILPHMADAKSPQGVAGLLIKRLFCARHGLDPARVYHVAIMPCFDKKLEASRPDLAMSLSDVTAARNNGAHSVAACCQDDADGACCQQDGEQMPSTGREGVVLTDSDAGHDRQASSLAPARQKETAAPAVASENTSNVAETDCVLATNEVHALLVERGVDLRTEALAAMDAWLGATCGQGSDAGVGSQQSDRGEEASGVGVSVLRGVRGGSGGFLEFVLRFAAHELFGQVRHNVLFVHHI